MTSITEPGLISRLGRRPGVVGVRRRLHRLGNPVTARVLRSRLRGMLSGSVALLTVTGQRSGRQYGFPVQYARSGRVIVVVPGGYEHKTWWRNLRVPAPVRIRIAGRDLSGTGQALAGAAHPHQVAEGLQLYLTRFPSSAAQRGISLDANGQPRRAELLAAAGREVIVRIVLAGADAGAVGAVHTRTGHGHRENDSGRLRPVRLP